MFLLLVVSMFLITSCALEEIELKADPTIKAPIAAESISLSDLVDAGEIESSLRESFGDSATVTTKSNDPLTYGVDLEIFNGTEILDKIAPFNFSNVPAGEYPLVTPDASITLASFSASDLGILEDIKLVTLPATFVIKDAEGVTVDATLNSGGTKVNLTSGVEKDLVNFFDLEGDLILDSMSITFENTFTGDATPVIELLVNFPFKFTTTKDIELYTNKDEVGEDDILGRDEESADDWNDILDGIESLKLHMDYDNTTGLPLKMEVQGWDVDKNRPTASKPVMGLISADEDQTVEFNLTGLIEDMKDTVPFNLVFTVILPESGTGSVNMNGSLDFNLWLDLDTELTIPITLRPQ